jgi:hypothetical protein
MDPSPEYRRAETRYETATGTLPVERHVTTSRFARVSPAQSSYGWFLIVIGAIVALACLALPDRASRVVTYR